MTRCEWRRSSARSSRRRSRTSFQATRTLRAVADTGPLVAAANRGERAHRLAAEVVALHGRGLVILDVVAAEADHFLRTRVGAFAGRALMQSLAREEHSLGSTTSALLKRAVELDVRYADLGLGLVDASIMAYAERHDLPILTFDFRHFRATESAHGPWRLVLDEDQLRRALG